MRYNPKHYVVETHFEHDVTHKDYGPESFVAMRAVNRLRSYIAENENERGINAVRVWFGGICEQNHTTRLKD